MRQKLIEAKEDIPDQLVEVKLGWKLGVLNPLGLGLCAPRSNPMADSTVFLVKHQVILEVYSWKISYAAAKKDVVEIGESGDLVFNDELFVSITKQN